MVRIEWTGGVRWDACCKGVGSCGIDSLQGGAGRVRGIACYAFCSKLYFGDFDGLCKAVCPSSSIAAHALPCVITVESVVPYIAGLGRTMKVNV